MPKLSIKALMWGISLSALAFCGLRDPDPFWERTVFTASFLTLAGGILAAVGARAGERRAWVGFCVGGWLYWFAIFGPWASGTIRPMLLTDHLVTRMTEEYRGPSNTASYLDDLNLLARNLEKDAETAEAEVAALQRGGLGADSPEFSKAETRAKNSRFLAYRARKDSEDYVVTIRSRSPWAQYFLGVIRPEPFGRVFHSLVAILAACSGWFAVARMQRPSGLGAIRTPGEDPGLPGPVAPPAH